MAYDNLRDVGPIIYSGQGPGGGHCFVCDGYSYGYFHFNWGWGGTSDGYFLMNACNPQDTGIGGGTGGGFNSDQSMVLGIQRPVSGSTQKPLPLTQNGNLVVEKSSDTGLQLSVNGATFVNRNYFNVSGTMKVYYLNGNAWNQLQSATFTVLSLTTAIDEISDCSGREAPVYFDLQGNRIDNPQPGHMYIRKTGSSVMKVLLR